MAAQQYSDRRHRYSYNVKPDESILTSTWADPTRPYSQKELSIMKQRFFQQLTLDKEYVQHEECGHQYYVKSGGVKFKQLKLPDSVGRDIGNCSVCWKLRRTPRSIYNNADNFIRLYMDEFPVLDTDYRYSFYNNEIQTIFYTWLYKEEF
jgi:hypothetical protein